MSNACRSSEHSTNYAIPIMFKFPLRSINSFQKSLLGPSNRVVRLSASRLARGVQIQSRYSSNRHVGDKDKPQTQRHNSGRSIAEGGDDDQQLYLHVGPSGDCWTGSSIFAAKHLQPDYVKSIVLPGNVDIDIIDSLLEQLEADPSVAQTIYDQETIPPSLLVNLSAPTDAAAQAVEGEPSSSTADQQS
jgi:hypothetical protein